MLPVFIEPVLWMLASNSVGGGSLVGSITSYMTCSLILGLPSGRTSFLWCAIIAGGTGGYIGASYVGNLGIDVGNILYERLIPVTY